MPDFKANYDNTVQKISVKFHSLEVMLHQEAILNLLAFVKTLLPPPKATPAPPQRRASRRLSVASLSENLTKGMKLFCFVSMSYFYIYRCHLSTTSGAQYFVMFVI